MSSKRSRPWDNRTKKRVRIPPPSSAAASQPKTTSAIIPNVEIGSTRFYSDRFYLHRSVYDDDGGCQKSAARASTSMGGCQCGAKNPPPLFDRSALVASLDLKAAIFATYSLNADGLAQEFPCLFGKEASIPTLVLHGNKGWTLEKATEAAVSDEDAEEDPDSQPLSPLFAEMHTSVTKTVVATSEAVDDGGVNGDDECTIHTQEEETLFVAASTTYADPGSPQTPTKPKAKITGRQESTISNSYDAFPTSVHFSEVTASWIRPSDVPKASSGLLDENGGLSDQILQKRKCRQGVHHPKFMILFESSGSVVVVVSTANLNFTHTTEGSWIQRFPPSSSSSSNDTAATTSSKDSPTDCCDGSDFGAVLCNFLHCQMLSIRSGQLTTLAFLEQHFGWKSLKAMERSFCFKDAQVHLVPTVPGDHDSQRTFLYGRQRVADILRRLSMPQQQQQQNGTCNKPWLSPTICSDQDRLVFQPTSFGAEWNGRNMADVVRSYLCHNEEDDKTSTTTTTTAAAESSSSIPRDDALMKRLDIVWPTDYFVQEVKRSITNRRHSPNSVMMMDRNNMSFASANEDDDEDANPEKESEGLLFLSANTFNRISLECLSQMVMFEPSLPAQRETTLVPHFKSVARLFEGSDYRLRKDYGFGKSEECFPWFLLTSACLSRGAQGERCNNYIPAGSVDAVSYANFELGVLFVSRLCGDPTTDRLYCWKPSQCSCNSGGGGMNGNGSSRRSSSSGVSRLIHLPIPYCLRPARYQEDEEEVDFCETPYFHEILPGTACVGHMLLTPYGTAIAAAQRRDEET